MRADSLAFGQRLDPGGGEGGFLDAKAWIDQHQPFRKQFGKMRGVAIGARGADPYGLRDVVDPHENQIEPPRPPVPRYLMQPCGSSNLAGTPSYP